MEINYGGKYGSHGDPIRNSLGKLPCFLLHLAGSHRIRTAILILLSVLIEVFVIHTADTYSIAVCEASAGDSRDGAFLQPILVCFRLQRENGSPSTAWIWAYWRKEAQDI